MSAIDIVPGKVSYIAGFLGPGSAEGLMTEILATSPWSQERLSIRGGEVTVPFPRLVAWHGDPGIGYSYSGIIHMPQPWTDPLLTVRDKLTSVLSIPTPNGCLLNRYRTGQDSIGRHADREVDLVTGSPIACVSLGAPREIRFRPAGGKAKDEIRLTLEPGSLLLMYGDCQRTWTHEIKKVPEAGERVSLTFRAVKTEEKPQ